MTEPTRAQLFTEWLAEGAREPEPGTEAPESTRTGPRPDPSQGSHGATAGVQDPMQRIAHGLLDMPYADGRGNWFDLHDAL